MSQQTDRPPIPDDLAAHGWHWNTNGFLTSADGLLIISWPAPRCFDDAHIVEATRERLAERRGPKQQELGL